ncbi:MAG: hypothetical protein ABL861_10925 [Nitrosomonas sp.]
MVHVSFAQQKLDPTEAERTLAMYAEISTITEK